MRDVNEQQIPQLYFSDRASNSSFQPRTSGSKTSLWRGCLPRTSHRAPFAVCTASCCVYRLIPNMTAHEVRTKQFLVSVYSVATKLCKRLGDGNGFQQRHSPNKPSSQHQPWPSRPQRQPPSHLCVEIEQYYTECLTLCLVTFKCWSYQSQARA